MASKIPKRIKNGQDVSIAVKNLGKYGVVWLPRCKYAIRTGKLIYRDNDGSYWEGAIKNRSVHLVWVANGPRELKKPIASRKPKSLYFEE